MTDQPLLKPLHSSLNTVKLEFFEKLSTEQIKETLIPGQECCLKTRPDGTILDGHHRIDILRARGENVDLWPREVITKQEDA
jgi:hypothetical protein